MKLYESDVEEAAIQWLQELGYTYVPGPKLSEGAFPERPSTREVLLEGRLRAAIRRLNPRLADDSLEEVVRQVRALKHSPSLPEANLGFHRLLVRGVPLQVRRGPLTRGDTAWLVDWQEPANNEWLVVNQLTVVGTHERRPDVVVYLNGFPVAVVELKDPQKKTADNRAAWNQLQTYKQQVPDLFVSNGVLVVGDGVKALTGSLTAGFERFMPWRTIDGVVLAHDSEPQLKVLLHGLFEKRRLLDYLRHFVLFETDDGIIKKNAAYHQYHAVNKAVEATMVAARPAGNRRIGVVWHTQGSGKSISMAFFAGKVIQAMGNPTLVVVTDRQDLDGQLYAQFAAARDLVPEPHQATSRDDLRAQLQVASGGVVFATMQKFSLTEDEREKGSAFPTLTERTNVVVIADEAHRTQYGFDKKVSASGKVSSGFAANLRTALPNASFIGFTGTPVELDDRSTPEVFGHYIDVYSISRAVEDHSTVPIYYEARLARLDLPEDEKPKVDEAFEEETEAEDDATRAKLQRKWASLEAVVGTKKRLKLVARDIVDHFRRRTEILSGKGMIVAMSRRVAAELYEQIVRLHSDWHDPDDAKGAIKVVMTSTPDDPPRLKKHMRDKRGMREIEKRFKNPDDPLRLVIVVDMWLTGFDVPCAHTMYIDKPLKGHGLMQAIARVNRVWKDKPSGLVVDYLGVAAELKKAVRWYDRGQVNQERPGLPVEEALAELQKRVEVVQAMFHGFDWSGFFTAQATARVETLSAGADFALGLHEGKKRFREAMLALNKAASIALHLEPARQFLDDITYFQAVQQTLAKNTVAKGESNDALHAAIRQIVSRAVVPGEVHDLLALAGLAKPEISVLSEDFLEAVRASPHVNLQLETLRKLLKDELRALSKRNVVAAKKFSDKLEEAVKKYENRSIEAVAVVEELVKLARAMRERRNKAKELNLSDDELAFYDALIDKGGIREVMGDAKLAAIAQDLVESIRRTVSIDWTQSEAVRAKMRTRVKRLLRKHGYPPDDQVGAALTVLEQAKAVCRDWGTDGVPRTVPLAAEGAVAYEVRPRPEYAAPAYQPMSGLWLEVMDLVEEPGLHDVLRTLHQAGLEAPEPGWEAMVGHRVAGELELAWPSARVGVVLPDQLADLQAAELSDAGWNVFTYPFSVDGLLRALR